MQLFFYLVPLCKMDLTQDLAPAYAKRAVQQFLWQHFKNDKEINRYFSIIQPPRTSDMTAYDFCLWGYFKSNVYFGGVENLNDLRYHIKQHMLNITPEALYSAIVYVAGFCLPAQWPWGTWTLASPRASVITLSVALKKKSKYAIQFYL